MYLSKIILSLVGLLQLAGAIPVETAQASVSPRTTTNKTTNATEYQNVVYFSNAGIYAEDYQPTDLPAANLSIVLYAFGVFDVNGTVYSSDPYADTEKLYANDSSTESGTNAYGCVKQLYRLKKENRHMRVLLSLGGTSTTDFSVVASTEETRATFARTAVDLINDWGFDGIDIDWEYPEGTDDKANFVLLAQALRDQLDTYAAQYAPGYHFLLTIASYAGESHYQWLDFPGLSAVIDYYNLMAYDYSGSWVDYAGHQANLHNNENDTDATPYFTDAAIQGYVDGGVETGQILLGIPLYGRSFTSTEGIGKAYYDIGNNSIAYKSLPKAGATVSIDNTSVASYSYDPTTQELVTFDTPEIVRAKAAYIKTEGLGGAMFWEASLDKADENSLVNAAYGVLGRLNTTTKNLLSYPQSRYANIKANLE